MKIKVAVEARIDARDRRRCMESCPWFRKYPFAEGNFWCEAYCADLAAPSLYRPLRCRMCLRNEVRP